jgi:glutathione S-transferase
MPDVILHHFDNSPFSEKVRLILGFKQLAWRSVEVPRLLPKPDVVALTGGYRRTPVLQIGADIYCDTALMARVIDGLVPQPPLYLASATAAGGLQHLIAQWADSTLFWTAIPYTTQPAGIVHVFKGATPEFLKALGADRAAMTAGMRRVTPVDAAAQLGSYFAWLESLLAGGQAFLLGASPCIADFSVAQCVWFMHLAPPLTHVLTPFEKLAAWYERVIAIGQAPLTPLDSAEALAIAARATGHAATRVEAGLGFEAGAQVTVMATDYAADLVPGTLVGLSVHEVVIERSEERAGTVHVHFPRIGYQIKKAS